MPHEVTKYGMDDLDRAIADSEAHGFVKVLTVPGKDTILGTIHTSPTLSEANKYAAGEWKCAHAPQALLAWDALLTKHVHWLRLVEIHDMAADVFATEADASTRLRTPHPIKNLLMSAKCGGAA